MLQFFIRFPQTADDTLPQPEADCFLILFLLSASHHRPAVRFLTLKQTFLGFQPYYLRPFIGRRLAPSLRSRFILNSHLIVCVSSPAHSSRALVEADLFLISTLLSAFHHRPTARFLTPKQTHCSNPTFLSAFLPVVSCLHLQTEQIYSCLPAFYTLLFMCHPECHRFICSS